MTIQDLFSILGYLISLGTLLGIFWTICVMEKQRKDAQKPELMIPDNVEVFGFKDGGLIESKWLNYNTKNEAQKNYQNSFFINLYNIGFGAAKNVTIKWRFDFDAVVKKIKDYLVSNNIPIDVTIENNAIELKIKDINSSQSTSVDDKAVPFILPSSIILNGAKIDFPTCFSFIYSLLLYLQKIDDSCLMRSCKVLKNSLNDFCPKIELSISYSDISKTKYTKSFSFEFKHFASVQQVDDNFATFIGRLTVTEKHI